MKNIYESHTIAEEERVPSMRIAVTGACNLKCQYCPIDGDNYVLHVRKFLSNEDFSRVATNAYEVGIRHFSITGGEPLAVPKTTFEVAETVRKFPNLGYLRLNTNGIALKQHADRIQDVGFHKIKVSLDSLRTGKYENPSQRSNSQIKLSNVLEGIDEMLNRGITTRVNMVVGKYNINEVQEMIEFCTEKNLELKLFDITFYRDALSHNNNFWNENYISLNPLCEELEERFGSPRIVYAVGGFGNPMPIFKPNSSSPIRVRTSEKTARYRKECEECLDYMCQDGFCNITLTTNGNLKLCRPEGLDFDLRLVNGNGDLLSDKDIKIKLIRAIELFRETQTKERSLDEMVKSWRHSKTSSTPFNIRIF